MPGHFNFESQTTVVSPPDVETILAVDGSVRGFAHSGAYIASNGLFGVIAANYSKHNDRCKPHCVNATELRAALYGLSAVGDQKTTLLTDSLTAAGWLDSWQRGHDDLPSWYSTDRVYARKSSLEKLRNLVMDRTQPLDVQLVKGHSGHLLNEAADSLAGIGSNVLKGVYPADEAQRRSSSLTTSFLLSHSEN